MKIKVDVREKLEGKYIMASSLVLGKDNSLLATRIVSLAHSRCNIDQNSSQ
jgi:hypothetical protein